MFKRDENLFSFERDDFLIFLRFFLFRCFNCHKKRENNPKKIQIITREETPRELIVHWNWCRKERDFFVRLVDWVSIDRQRDYQLDRFPHFDVEFRNFSIFPKRKNSKFEMNAFRRTFKSSFSFRSCSKSFFSRDLFASSPASFSRVGRWLADDDVCCERIETLFVESIWTKIRKKRRRNVFVFDFYDWHCVGHNGWSLFISKNTFQFRVLNTGCWRVSFPLKQNKTFESLEEKKSSKFLRKFRNRQCNYRE